MKKLLLIFAVVFMAGCKKEPIECKIHNEISPNGDSINDVFFVNCTDSRFPTKVIIFTNDNREAFVYSNLDYKNDWDGGRVPDGLYFYRVQNRFMDKTGWVTLIR